MSQRGIARHVGCTESFVRKVKTEIEAICAPGAQIEPDSEPKKEVSRSKTVKVKRGKSEYEMKTAQKKTLDSTGKKVPEHLITYFERANEYRAMIKQLNDQLKTVRKGIETCVKCGGEVKLKDAKAGQPQKATCQEDGQDCHGDLFYRFIKIENLTAEIGNVKRIFRFAMPYAVCCYCGGDEMNAECRSCDGAGFVNEMGYKATLEELK